MTDTRRLLEPSQEEVGELVAPIIAEGFGDLEKKRLEDTELTAILYDGFDDDGLWVPEEGEAEIILASSLPDSKKDRLRVIDLVQHGTDMSLVAQCAMLLNGSTEDNVTQYAVLTQAPFAQLGFTDAADAQRFWVSDESMHQKLFSDFQSMTRFANPAFVARVMRNQIAKGAVPNNETFEETFIYTSFQEPHTNTSHANSNRHLNPSPFKKPVGEMAGQELEHTVPYFAAALAVRQHFPDRFLVALANVLEDFQMPGTGVENFTQMSAILARAGVFNIVDVYNTHQQIVTAWDIESITPQTEESEQAMRRIEESLQEQKDKANDWNEKEARMRTAIEKDESKARSVRNPFVPGERVVIPMPKSPKIVGRDSSGLAGKIKKGRELVERVQAA